MSLWKFDSVLLNALPVKQGIKRRKREQQRSVVEINIQLLLLHCATKQSHVILKLLALLEWVLYRLASWSSTSLFIKYCRAPSAVVPRVASTVAKPSHNRQYHSCHKKSLHSCLHNISTAFPQKPKQTTNCPLHEVMSRYLRRQWKLCCDKRSSTPWPSAPLWPSGNLMPFGGLRQECKRRPMTTSDLSHHTIT